MKFHFSAIRHAPRALVLRGYLATIAVLVGGVTLLVLELGLGLGLAWRQAALLALSGAIVSGLVLTIPLCRLIMQMYHVVTQPTLDGTVAHAWIDRMLLPDLATILTGLEARTHELVVLQEQALRHAQSTAVEAERTRIAQDLHDTIKQELCVINMAATSIEEWWGRDLARAQADLQRIQQAVHRAIGQTNILLTQLRPETISTLRQCIEALRVQAEALRVQAGVEIQVVLGVLPADDRLPPDTPMRLFQIAREALANIGRHARARQVTIRLDQPDDSLVLEVVDDGQGFDTGAAKRKMGCINMAEWAAALSGSLDVKSQLGQGSIVQLAVPLHPSIDIVTTVTTWTAWVAAVQARILRLRPPLWTVLPAMAIGYGHPFWLVFVGLLVLGLTVSAVLLNVWSAHRAGRVIAAVAPLHPAPLELRQRSVITSEELFVIAPLGLLALVLAGWLTALRLGLLLYLLLGFAIIAEQLHLYWHMHGRYQHLRPDALRAAIQRDQYAYLVESLVVLIPAIIVLFVVWLQPATDALPGLAWVHHTLLGYVLLRVAVQFGLMCFFQVWQRRIAAMT